MNFKKLKNVSLAFSLSLFALCLFNTGIVKAEAMPAKYNMDLDFNASTKTLTGNEEVTIKNNTGTNLKDLVFHLYPDSYNKKETMPSQVGIPGTKDLTEVQKGDISIDKVLVNDKEVKFTQDNQILKINLDEDFKSNEDVKIYVGFKLKLPMGTSRLGYMDNDYSLTNWYPILSMYDTKENKWDENTFNVIGESNYSDMADYNVNLKVPKDYVVASTGKESEKSSEKDSKVMNLNASNVRDFVIMMSPNYKVLSKEIDGIKVNSYYIVKNGEDDNSTAQNVLDSAVGAVKFFSQQFGKYPYDELDLMESHLSGGAMEYPQIIQMPMYPQKISNSNRNNESSMSSSYENSFISEAAVHEVGHQWWYVTVGNNEFKEPFLDESLTAFSTAYYFEKAEGEYSKNSILRMISVYSGENIGRFTSQYKFASIGSGVDKFNKDSTGSGYSLVIYGKGPLLIEDLRKKVGDTVFLDIMQTYFKEYKFKNSSIEGFLSVIEKKAGETVSDAIKASLNSDNYTAENLKLTDEQIQKMADEQYKDKLKDLEKNNGLILGSLQLRVLNGEKAILVKPSNLSADEKKSLDDITKTIPSNSNISIKEDKDLTDNDIKNNNIILVGNPWNNKVFDSMKNDLPILVTKDSISCSSFSFKNENINGAFTVKNPKNDTKLMSVLFWTKDNSLYTDFNLFTNSQFTISIDNKQFFNGNF